ncbi:MAG TPA: Na+/H+ antiporter NhaA [Ilumatobacteraceae bacterium]|nr:Na+/H+ antiporter NhaA [Ilumatobacteraceae bacterium]
MPLTLPRKKRSPLVRALAPMRDFLHTEAAGGALLVAAAVAALVWANSPWSASYENLWASTATIEIAGHGLSLDLRHWVNDALMALFFLIVGLEIKREMTSGHLAGRRAAALPVAAALGGMIIPAALYLAIAGGTEPKGWGVPMATDIALAVGVLALAGSSVPATLRAFLLGLAVVDDIGAIVVIAIFYSQGVSFSWLSVAAGALALLLAARRWGVSHLGVYVALGTVMWFALHEAGVHPTLAGVICGLLAPVQPRHAPELIDIEDLTNLSTVEDARGTVELARNSVSTVEWLEHLLHPWTSYLIVPLFAFANAGIEVSTDSMRSAFKSPIMWGVLVGLMVGKPLGVMLAVKFAERSGFADRPAGTSSRQLLGAGNAAGIGFTVAIFIAELAFDTEEHRADAKMAILVASLLSGLLAFAVLRSRRRA